MNAIDESVAQCTSFRKSSGWSERKFEASARVGAERHLAPTRSRVCAYLRRSVHGRRAFEFLSSARRTLKECSRRRPGQPDLFWNGVHSATDSSTAVHALQRRGVKALRAVTNPGASCPPTPHLTSVLVASWPPSNPDKFRNGSVQVEVREAVRNSLA